MNQHSDAIIHIKDLKIHAVIGTLPQERTAPQELSADISFKYNAAMAIETDALVDAVDYAHLHAAILTRAAETRFLLIEKLAAFILAIIMEDPRIATAMVSLEKPGVLFGAKSVAVSLSAQRSIEKPSTTNRCY
jgi:FolB domain-containing protein